MLGGCSASNAARDWQRLRSTSVAALLLSASSCASLQPLEPFLILESLFSDLCFTTGVLKSLSEVLRRSETMSSHVQFLFLLKILAFCRY